MYVYICLNYLTSYTILRLLSCFFPFVFISQAIYYIKSHVASKFVRYLTLLMIL